MTPEEITFVHGSFVNVVPINDAATEKFHAPLFQIAPAMKPYFKGGVRGQSAKSVKPLGVDVYELRDMGKIVPVAESLAIKRVEHGAKAEDYALVAPALIYMQEQSSGNNSKSELQASWVAAYATLSSTMTAAAYPKAGQ